MLKDLYFIALLPPAGISRQITNWKEEMAEKFGARHALKSPPHITLQMPFRRKPGIEKEMTLKLEHFARDHSGMDIHLSGFGSFPPRVIYVKVADPGPVVKIYEALQAFLKAELQFSQNELTQRFLPHITIATRDLRKNVFSQAWSDFKNLEYHAHFYSHELSLLKHDGRQWEVFRTIELKI